MDRGLITPGPIYDCDIRVLDPSLLRGFDRVHLFAGIAGWDYALTLAGWPAARPVWTCSCPCQPFSDAGVGEGFEDPRHLWPEAFRLVRFCSPSVIFGEQVSSPLGRAWLDVVQVDLENYGYAFGALVAPVAGVGAPHGRHRIFFVADAPGARSQGGRSGLASRPWGQGAATQRSREAGGVADADGDRTTQRDARNMGRNQSANSTEESRRPQGDETFDNGLSGRVADADRRQRDWVAEIEGCEPHRSQGEWEQGDGGAAGDRRSGGLADAAQGRRQARFGEQGDSRGARGGGNGFDDGGCDGWPGPVNGFWRDADWLFCRDGKWRSVEPGAQPLAYGASARVGRLRAYGNCIAPALGKEFIESYLDLMDL
jgi:DNA (cytosine-5)-methyltransferase 1